MMVVDCSHNTLLTDLARRVAADGALLHDGWTHLVLVSCIDAGAPDLTGFCYTAEGRAVPVAPSGFGLLDTLQQLRLAMAAADAQGRTWQAALLRLERASGKLKAEFEYEHPERWAVTPENVAARAREFAPA